MKQIRRGVFETNSSSVHSITMCSQEEYSKWESGELYKERYGDEFKTKEEIVKELKEKTHWKTKELIYADVDWNDVEVVNDLIKENGYFKEEEYWDDLDYETFSDTYTTKTGETVVAFGYYGEDR